MEKKFHIRDVNNVAQASRLCRERVSTGEKNKLTPALLARAGWKPALH